MLDLKPRFKAAKLRAKDFLRSTALDERGVAAIEFAFIAPVMLVFYFGMVDISLAVEADRNVSHATSLVGDLSAQDAVVTKSMIEDYIYGALAVLDVDAEQAEKVGLELYAFEVITPDNPSTTADERVIAETGFATFGPSFDGGTKFDPSTIQDKILTDTSGVIVARMTYEYTSKITGDVVGTKTFDETFMLKPRRSATVRFDNENGNADVTQSYNMTCAMSKDGDDVPIAECTAA